jgi:hypothetical protein
MARLQGYMKKMGVIVKKENKATVNVKGTLSVINEDSILLYDEKKGEEISFNFLQVIKGLDLEGKAVSIKIEQKDSAEEELEEE